LQLDPKQSGETRGYIDGFQSSGEDFTEDGVRDPDDLEWRGVLSVSIWSLDAIGERENLWESCLDAECD